MRSGVHSRRGAASSPNPRDRKSTRLNSSHDQISYAVFCLKKKNINTATLVSENSFVPVAPPGTLFLDVLGEAKDNRAPICPAPTPTVSVNLDMPLSRTEHR